MTLEKTTLCFLLNGENSESVLRTIRQINAAPAYCGVKIAIGSRGISPVTAEALRRMKVNSQLEQWVNGGSIVTPEETLRLILEKVDTTFFSYLEVVTSIVSPETLKAALTTIMSADAPDSISPTPSGWVARTAWLKTHGIPKVGSGSQVVPAEIRSLVEAPPEIPSEPEDLSELSVGLVIGAYGAVPYIHLQLESLRRFNPGMPVLVVDDGSPQCDQMAALCQHYGAEFSCNPKRLGHVPGDLSVFLTGHAWAKANNLKWLVKFSQRWIPITPWVEEMKKLISRSEGVTLSSRCKGNRFGFRSECVAMNVAAWDASDSLKVLRDAMERSKTGFVLVEALVHTAAKRAYGKFPPKSGYENQAPGSTGYVKWPFMGESRKKRNPSALWHEANSPAHYLEQCRVWGLPYSSLVNPQTILLKRRAALGDVLCATPILRELKRRNPAAHIEFVTDCQEVLRDNPAVDHISFSASNNYNSIYDLDLAYERHPRTHIVDAYAKAVFGDAPLQDKSLFLERRKVTGLPLKFAALHCTTSWPSRTLPLETWQLVSRGLRAEGIQVVLIGTPSDMAPEADLDLRGRLSLAETAGVINAACIFVGNDSGLLHVAGTTETPIVGIFTCVKAEYRLPYRHGDITWKTRAVTPALDCYGCLATYRSPVTSLPRCRRGDLACVTRITAAQILEATFEFLIPDSKTIHSAMSETSKCRNRLIGFCHGIGLDIGFGGDPIKPDAITIDLPENQARVGRAPQNIQASCESLPWFADGTIDYVFSSHLIEDFSYEMQAQILDEWARILRVGGVIVLYQPDQRTYRAHCLATGQILNTAHKEDDYSLTSFQRRVLPKVHFPYEILHSAPQVDIYSWECVLRKC